MKHNKYKVYAWCVHGFTASGLLIAFICLLAISEKNFRLALLCLIIALVIDAVDGSLARRLNVKEVLPHFDGKMLDWVTDFVNFSFLPTYLFYQAELVPSPIDWVCVIAMLFSSAYHFGNKSAITDEGYFKGFPAFWNIIVFYLLLIPLPVAVNVTMVLVFFILHFLPVYFVYPTRMRSGFNSLINLIVFITITSAFFAAMGYAVPNSNPFFVQASVIGVLFLLLVCIGLTVIKNRGLSNTRFLKSV